MSIYFGNASNVSELVDGLYIGNGNSIRPKKVYAGDENNLSRKVFGDDDYQYVEYIGISTPGALIDTGIVPTNTTKVYVEAAYTSNQTLYFGSRTGGTQTSYYTLLLASSCRFQFGASSSTTMASGVSGDTKYGIWLNDNKTFHFDGQSGITSSNTLSSATKSLWLFGLHSGGTTSNQFSQSGSFYVCKIWQDNVLVRDLRPCYRKVDDVIGMHDKVTGNFFMNANTTGTFKKGGDI